MDANTVLAARTGLKPGKGRPSLLAMAQQAVSQRAGKLWLPPISPSLASAALLGLALSGGMGVGWLPAAQAQPAMMGTAADRDAVLNDTDGAPITRFEMALNAQARFACRKATFWTQAGAEYALLTGDVRFNIETHGFRASQALVRIDKVQDPNDPELVVRHLSIYLDHARTDKDLVVAAEAQRLLVTASTTGSIAIDTDLPEAVAGPPNVAFVKDGYDRIKRYFSPLRVSEQASATHEPGQLTQQAQINPDQDDPDRNVDSVLPLTGTVLWNAARFDATLSPEGGLDPRLTLSGGVELMYQDAASDRVVTLQAQNVVVFLDTDSQGGSTLSAKNILGIYLEGGVVIQDGDYTVRTPRAYYDLVRDRAVLLEAVVYTFDQRRKIPMYVRAEVIRQLARTTFEADQAVLSTSAFAIPHFSIGASKLTVRPNMQPVDSNRSKTSGRVIAGVDASPTSPLQQGSEYDPSGLPVTLPGSPGGKANGTDDPSFAQQSEATDDSDGGNGDTVAQGLDNDNPDAVPDLAYESDGSQHFTAEGMNIKWGRTPVFWWPVIAGDTQSIPLKRAQLSSSDRQGTVLETEWDFNALLGRPKTPGVDTRLKLDWLGNHGPAGGMVVGYDQDNMQGRLEGYVLPEDQGIDDLGGRVDVDRDGDMRGLVDVQHRQQLGNHTQMQLRADYVSDATFLELYDRNRAYVGQESETSVYLIRQQNDWSAALLARTDANDFMPQLNGLQATGYTVERLPEASFYKIGTPLFDGRLTYFGETRVSAMRLRYPENTPGDHGFNNASANDLFGLNATDPFALRYDFNNDGTADWSDDQTLRGDTRHEFAAPMRLGNVDMTPYAVARLTAYSEDELAPDAENNRLWGQLGVRASTSFQTGRMNVNNRLLDINGMRHIVEPSANAWVSASSADSNDLLVYDESVEGINDEPGVRFGVRNTWQTQRGGQGLWRSVDWITWDSDVVFSDTEGDNTNGFSRWFNQRPEYVRGGDHFYTDLRWQVTDTFAAGADATYLLDDPTYGGSRLAQWQLGGTLTPDPALMLFGNYEVIDVLDSKLINYGFNIDLTDKYALLLRHRIDLSSSESRQVNLGLFRQLPQWEVGVMLSQDDINDETRFSIALTPRGFTRSRMTNFKE